MTEKQKALLENLPRCNNNVNKAAKLAGYSDMTANKAIYTMLGKNRIKGIKSEERVKAEYLREIKRAKKIMLSNKDNTNYLRSLEIEGKVKGLFKEATASGNTTQVIIDRQGLTNVSTKPIPINNQVNSEGTKSNEICTQVNDGATAKANDTATPPIEEGK